jgi:hypothetical protein
VDIKNAKNRAKTTKLWLKQILGLICKLKLSSRAKLKKTGPIRKGFHKVGGPGCNFRKTQGCLNKNARVSKRIGSDPLDRDLAVRIKSGADDR